jgi:hypothetical protein
MALRDRYETNPDRMITSAEAEARDGHVKKDGVNDGAAEQAEEKV